MGEKKKEKVAIRKFILESSWELLFKNEMNYYPPGSRGYSKHSCEVMDASSA